MEGERANLEVMRIEPEREMTYTDDSDGLDGGRHDDS